MDNNSFRQEAEQLVNDNEILMISKSWCPDCHFMYKVWDQYGLASKVKILELDKMKDQDHAVGLESEFSAMAGEKWVPTIFFRPKNSIVTDRHFREWEMNGTTEQELKRLLK